jgi:primary-amine oxidase
MNQKEIPYGTVVHDQVLAGHHQHIFSLRIDPAIDGYKNSFVIEEAQPIPVGRENPYGNGFVLTKRTVENPGFEDLDVAKGRVFKIVNEASRNPVNGGPTGYRIFPYPSQVSRSRMEVVDNRCYSRPRIRGTAVGQNSLIMQSG